MSSQPRIFMLEDDPLVLQLVEIEASSQGWAFSSAQMIAGAVETARRFRPDLMLIDVSLPDGEGFQFCREARADAALASVPAFFLTSREDVASRLKGFASGAQDYVLKPFSVAELVARIRVHLGLKAQRESLQSEKEEMEIRERVRRDIIDMVVHDLRAPLAMIKGTLTLVLEAGLIGAADYHQMLKRAETASDFAILLIGDVLDVDAGGIRAQPAPLDLLPLLNKLKTLYWMHCRNNRLIFQLPPETASLRTDGTLLFRILVNLIQNALKFSAGPEPVELKVAVAPGRLRCEVLDRGPGIPAADKEKVFEMHYRSSSSSLTPGHGVGLAFCRMAAQALGGRIWAEDRSGGGSVLVLEIPC